MPGLGDAGVQKTLKGIISKSSKEQHRLGSASTKLSAASASRASALLGVLIQHESSGGCQISCSNPQRREDAPAELALDRQCRLLAADAPRAAQHHHSARAASSLPAGAPGHCSAAECPFCGSSMPAERLQAHVDAELQGLDAAAGQPSSLHSAATAQHAKQVLQPRAVQPSRTAQHTAGLSPRHCTQMGHLKPIPADHGPQRNVGVGWQHSGQPERPTLSAASRHCMQPAAQHASAVPGRHSTFPQQPRRPGKCTQRPHAGISTACGSIAAQQTLQAHPPPPQAQARPQLHHSRQQTERGQPSELCRGLAQQRAGNGTRRQLSGKRKAQVHVFGAGLGTGRRGPRPQRALPARQQGFNHYDNGRGLWDGDMAGLDGLETVGLDCWEGFGTMSMGRL